MVNKELNMTLSEFVMAVQVYGLKFRAMDDADYEAFAGAERDTLIAESDVAIYFLRGDRLDILTEDNQVSYFLSEGDTINF